MEKALLVDNAPVHQKATVIGLYAILVGIALFPTSLIAGPLCKYIGLSAPFYFCGIYYFRYVGVIGRV